MESSAAGAAGVRATAAGTWSPARTIAPRSSALNGKRIGGILCI